MDLGGLIDVGDLTLTVREGVVLLVGRVGVPVAIIVGAVAIGRVLSAASTRALDDRRGGTLVPIARGFVRGLALSVGVVMALDHVGIDVKAIIAGAGIVGIAVGFGAQSLVRDLISGFFLLLEDVVRVGDVATVGATTGTIEQVGLRMTQLRAQNGQLWFIPNGEIKTVGNFNRDWSRAIVDVGTAYEADVATAMRVLQAVGDEYARAHPDEVLERPEAQGVVAFNSSDLTLRLLVKVRPNKLWGVERELRVRIKEAYDREGIEIPYPRQVAMPAQRADDQPRSAPADVATTGSE